MLLRHKQDGITAEKAVSRLLQSSRRPPATTGDEIEARLPRRLRTSGTTSYHVRPLRRRRQIMLNQNK